MRSFTWPKYLALNTALIYLTAATHHYDLWIREPTAMVAVLTLITSTIVLAAKGFDQ